MRYSLFFMALGALVLSSCATLPEKIVPLEISNVPYLQWSCAQLSREQPKLASSLAAASEAQRRCRKTDIAGLLFIGLPVATLTGFNRSSEIARFKGELQALQRVAVMENCPLTVFPIEPSPQEDKAITKISEKSDAR